MKKKIFISMLLLSSASVFAQLRVNEYGHVTVGYDTGPGGGAGPSLYIGEQAPGGKTELRSGTEENSNPTGIQTIYPANLAHAFLFQNVPNPFQASTEIRYFIPQELTQAYICIFDMQGKMLKKANAFAGENTLTIQGSELQAGMYLYSLIVDEKEVDTKRMILTK